MNPKTSKLEQLLLGKGEALKLEIESLNGSLCRVCRRTVSPAEPLRIHNTCLEALSTNLCLDFLDLKQSNPEELRQRLGVETEIQNEVFMNQDLITQEQYVIQTYLHLCKRMVATLPSSFYIENIDIRHHKHEDRLSFSLGLTIQGIICCFICNSFHLMPRPWQMYNADPLIKSNLEGIYYHKECGALLLKSFQEGHNGSEIFK
jgi:hypothetical protein